MFVWRKRAGARWLAANETKLRQIAGARLAIISNPANKTQIAEVAATNRPWLESLRARFGGAIKKLPSNWLRNDSRARESKPLRIGKRLLVVSELAVIPSAVEESRDETFKLARRGPSTSLRFARGDVLVIPAGMAFGTGDHATTAMSLRLLERTMRKLRRQQAGSLRSPEKNLSVLDLGTGSGILALAATRFGAQRVIALDSDPLAISTAKENARRNKILNVEFHLADVRQLKLSRRIDIVTANLFSELLIAILPKLKQADVLILSGILRNQGNDVANALHQNDFAISEIRRRGKWIAILATGKYRPSEAKKLSR